MEYKIQRARKENAPFIAESVMEAVGRELCIHLADGEENLPKVRELFTRLASQENSQYSYKNTFIAFSDSNTPIGAIIVYDGSRLRELRKAFIDAANDILGWNISYTDAEKWGDETEAGEIYIDSLYVLPAFRKNGIASALISTAMAEKERHGKPFGLLVEPDNINARHLYESLGFREVGISKFFTTPMLHLQTLTSVQQ